MRFFGWTVRFGDKPFASLVVKLTAPANILCLRICVQKIQYSQYFVLTRLLDQEGMTP
jgi:hypothetical protein